MSKLNFRALTITTVAVLALAGAAISQGEVVSPSADLVPAAATASVQPASSTSAKKHQAHRKGNRHHRKAAHRHHAKRK